MVTDEELWNKEIAATLLKEVGVKNGSYVIDFGCRDGNYLIPAAKIVGDSGKVYGIEKVDSHLDMARERAGKERLENIVFIKNSEDNFSFANRDNSINVILLYDVLHYMTAYERSGIYRDSYRALKKDGILSIYPKHNRDDWPMQNTADTGVDELIDEVRQSGFILEAELKRKVLHNYNLESGRIFNFVKKDIN